MREVKCIEDIFKWLDEICDNESQYTDEQLTKELKEVYYFCSGGKDGKDFYFITHVRSEKLLEKRARKYCKENNIKLEDYKGVLPYRKYFIETLPR